MCQREREKGQTCEVSECVCMFYWLPGSGKRPLLPLQAHSLTGTPAGWICFDVSVCCQRKRFCTNGSLCVHSSLLRAERTTTCFCALPGGSAGQLDFYRFYYFLILRCEKRRRRFFCEKWRAALLSHELIFCRAAASFTFLLSAALEFN